MLKKRKHSVAGGSVQIRIWLQTRATLERIVRAGHGSQPSVLDGLIRREWNRIRLGRRRRMRRRTRP